MSFDIVLHRTRQGVVYVTFDEPATPQQLRAVEHLGYMAIYRAARIVGLVA